MRRSHQLSSVHLLLLSTILLLFSVGCSMEHEIVAKGKSEATITINKEIKFKLKGEISIPEGVPGLGGIYVGPGAEIDVSIPAGTEIKLDDKVDIDGEGTALSGSVQEFESTQQRTTHSTGIVTGMGQVDPIPLLASRYEGVILPGSTYTWTIPELFGDNEAVVQVTGEVTAVGTSRALVEDSGNGWTVNMRGLLSFSYQVSGPPPVWQAPFETPYGMIEGDGSIETVDPMQFEAIYNPNAMSGSGFEDYVDDEGNVWEYGYVGAFPVKLTVGNGSAIGATNVNGGFDLF